jgi:hypothetical protein
MFMFMYMFMFVFTFMKRSCCMDMKKDMDVNRVTDLDRVKEMEVQIFVLWRPVLARRMYLCTMTAFSHAYVQCTVLQCIIRLMYRNKLVLLWLLCLLLPQYGMSNSSILPVCRHLHVQYLHALLRELVAVHHNLDIFQ